MTHPKFRVPEHAMHPCFTINGHVARRAVAAEMPDGYAVTEWLGGMPQMTTRHRALPPVPMSLPAGWRAMQTVDEMLGGVR